MIWTEPTATGHVSKIAESGRCWTRFGATREEAEAAVMSAHETEPPDWDVNPWLVELYRCERKDDQWTP